MPIRQVEIEEFLGLARNLPVFDVRSPAEYFHAHIPDSLNLPIFNDEERAVIGTLYKKKGRPVAVRKGLEYFGPKMNAFIDVVLNASESVGKSETALLEQPVLIHCWRGGMRSGAMAWLLDLYGFNVYTLSGGYKAFRKWVAERFEDAIPLIVIGGYTGSEKTRILNHVSKSAGKQVIDLEALASHRGSAFGGLGMDSQPSQEMFENLLATKISSIGVKEGIHGDADRLRVETDAVWVEDESQRIGRLSIPGSFWNNMRNSTVFYLERPFHRRLVNIIHEYGSFTKEELSLSIERISKRLGGLETKTAKEFLSKEDISGCLEVLLRYYDKTYSKSLAKRIEPGKRAVKLSFTTESFEEISDILIDLINQKGANV